MWVWKIRTNNVNNTVCDLMCTFGEYCILLHFHLCSTRLWTCYISTNAATSYEVHQTWTLECREIPKLLRINLRLDAFEWNEKCSVNCIHTVFSFITSMETIYQACAAPVETRQLRETTFLSKRAGIHRINTGDLLTTFC